MRKNKTDVDIETKRLEVKSTKFNKTNNTIDDIKLFIDMSDRAEYLLSLETDSNTKDAIFNFIYHDYCNIMDRTGIYVVWSWWSYKYYDKMYPDLQGSLIEAVRERAQKFRIVMELLKGREHV